MNTMCKMFYFVKIFITAGVIINLASSQLSASDSSAFTCSPLTSDTLDMSCQLFNENVNCTADEILSGTVASFRCKSGYKFQHEPDFDSLTCVLGSWDNNVELTNCVPVDTGEEFINSDICGQTYIRPDIMLKFGNGAEVAEMFQMPWIALLVYTTKRDEKKYYCTGAVISERHVLTSARCVKYLKSSDRLVSVRVGELDYNVAIDCTTLDGERVCAPPPMEIPIETITPHPQYNRVTLENNIALLSLQQPIDFSLNTVKPICLPISQEERKRMFATETVSVAGWGLANKRIKNTILYKKDMPTVSNRKCILQHPAELGRWLKVTEKHMCFGGETTMDSCHGDNGGPIVNDGLDEYERRAVLYGIRSHGPECNSTAKPSVATRVGAYIDWIMENLGTSEIGSGRTASLIEPRIAL